MLMRSVICAEVSSDTFLPIVWDLLRECQKGEYGFGALVGVRAGGRSDLRRHHLNIKKRIYIYIY